jgi:rSAM/selenodomain-associated transferase 1
MIKSALLIFTRAPIAGQTKTRLIPLLGAQGAAEFHQTVLQSTLAEANASNFETVEIWCATENDHSFLKQCSLDYSSAMKIQQGSDLGEKMHHATETTLVENAFVVLIGSDCPEITTDILNQSYQHLSNGKDAVLGPASDGGYYLIGLKKPNSSIFQDIAWGEASVAERTRKNFADLGLEYVELEELSDIDTLDDYQRYISST